MFLSQFNVKIASLSLSRYTVSGRALTLLDWDRVPPRGLLDATPNDRNARKARVVKLYPPPRRPTALNQND